MTIADVLEGRTPFALAQLDCVEWLRSIPSGSVHLCVTDPAYESLEKHRAHGTTTRLTHSKSSSNDWFPIFPNSRFDNLFAELYRVLARNSHLYMFCDQETAFIAKPLGERAGFKFWKPLIWDKQTIGMGYHYRARYEMILFFEKGKRRLSDLGIADILSCPRVKRHRQCRCEEEKCVNDEREERVASTPRDTSNFPPSPAEANSSTFESGKDTTGRSPPGCKSTIGTRTSRTTRSATSTWLTPQRTSESTLAASFARASGGNPAASAESSSRSTASTGTSPPTGGGPSSAAASRVTFAPSSLARGGSGSRPCPRCGLDLGSFPTEKPVPLARTLIEQSSTAGEIVCDPFMGSGFAGVAAIELGRRFLGCDVADESIRVATERLHGVAEPAPIAVPDPVAQHSLFDLGGAR